MPPQEITGNHSILAAMIDLAFGFGNLLFHNREGQRIDRGEILHISRQERSMMRVHGAVSFADLRTGELKGFQS